MQKFLFTLCLTLLVMVFGLLYTKESCANPFLSKKTETIESRNHSENLFENNKDEAKTITDSKPSFIRLQFSKVLTKSVLLQRKLSKKMNDSILDIRDNHSYTVILVIMFFGFLYGIIHAIGPGHGKVIITSYFLSKKSGIKDGVLIGLYTAFTHGISSIIFVFFLNVTLRTFLSEQKEIYYIKMISYTLIIAIGLYLFIRTILENVGKIEKKEHNNVEQQPKKQKNREIYTISLITGMVPCPGSMLILLYAMSQDILWLGVLTVLSISLGISVTLISFGLIAILMRKTIIENRLGTRFNYLHYFEYGARYMGSSLITIIGLVLFLGNQKLV